MSSAACMLASAARLRSVSVCSTWSLADSASNSRVMLSSISTKPVRSSDGSSAYLRWRPPLMRPAPETDEPPKIELLHIDPAGETAS